ncbi:hypothetical protein N7508_009241 [Penicillium antarcticum]|uniref:uncharacterized protein n=1 Tax=Penicillium antarcticum TaxID=416450 RepID=UPI00239A8BC6|nr:uncharacterized protein N7508_009241 [Penicillium antarcticum]KAJ5294420.1 hypothetical protein N7508_009241 [Penicillium antarcticum]
MANPCMASFTSEGRRQLEVHSDWTGLQPSPVFKVDEICEFPTHLPFVHAVQNTPPSPLSTISSYESPESLAVASPTMTVQTVDQFSPGSSEDDREDQPGPTPYSHLIFRALKEAKDNKLPLQGIYNWFERNTDKAKSSGSKGWQNSIRHNLSMNAGFEAVKEELGPGKKAVNFWRLTPEAIRHGQVQSTTRYRKQASARKVLGANARAVQRQRTEIKGGNSLKAVKTRHPNTSCDEPNEIYHRQPMILSSCPVDDHYPRPDPQMMPHYISPALAPPIDNALQRYGMDSVIGCTNLPPAHNGSFYDSMRATLDNESFAPRPAAHAGWYASPSDHNIAMMTGSDAPVDLHHCV